MNALPNQRKGITHLRIVKTLATAAFGLCTLLVLAPSTPAQAEHPRYLHALSNLRQARAVLQTDDRREFAGERDHAIEEIDHAIKEIKIAVMEEGRNPSYTPPPADRGNADRPMRSALGLLDEADEDVMRGVDEGLFPGLQGRAVRHIDEARRTLRHALHMVEDDRRSGDRDRDRRY